MVCAESSPNGLANFSRISVNKRMVRWLISSFTRVLVVVDSEIGYVSFQFQAVSSFPLWGVNIYHLYANIETWKSVSRCFVRLTNIT